MKDEIKEILDRLKRIDHKEYIAFEFADSATFDEMARCFEERKKMADYITNLQEENKKLSKEIKKIKKEDDEIRDKNCFLVNGFHELDERIDKAIEIIKENTKYSSGACFQDLDFYICNELICVLQGSDNNENNK